MKYIYFIVIVLGNIVIETFQLLWFPVIYKLRKEARDVVREHFINNKLFILDLPVRDSNRPETYSVIKYWFYYWVVWVWLDDTVNDDIIDTNTMRKIYLNPKVSNFTKQRILNSGVLNNGNKQSYTVSGSDTHYTVTPSDYIILLQLLNSNYSNFKRRYFYTINTKHVFRFKLFGRTIGWLPIKYKEGHTRVYKLVY